MNAEFASRVARLRQRMAQAGVQVTLFDEIESLAWLSGYGNSENRWRCAVVPLEGEPFFLIRALDATPCRERTWIRDILSYRDWEDPFPVLAKAMAQRGLSSAKVGLDFNSYGMPLARFEQMRSALRACQFVDVGPLIWELRLRKSPAELRLLERSAEIAARRCRLCGGWFAARLCSHRCRHLHRTGCRSGSAGPYLSRTWLGLSARPSG
jgi:Xaa-Pro aminopeptidase